MENLAGLSHARVDEAVGRELKRSLIEAVAVPRSAGEVAYSVEGKLGTLRLHRCWYYWRVRGLVPLSLAKELYADPVGVTDIRVNHHCGCPDPREQVVWFAPCGKRVLDRDEERDALRYAAMDPAATAMSDIGKRVLAENLFADDPALYPGARGYVEGYDIDSELGLRIFADGARRYGLAGAEPAAVDNTRK